RIAGEMVVVAQVEAELLERGRDGLAGPRGAGREQDQGPGGGEPRTAQPPRRLSEGSHAIIRHYSPRISHPWPRIMTQGDTTRTDLEFRAPPIVRTGRRVQPPKVCLNAPVADHRRQRTAKPSDALRPGDPPYHRFAPAGRPVGYRPR